MLILILDCDSVALQYGFITSVFHSQYITRTCFELIIFDCCSCFYFLILTEILIGCKLYSIRPKIYRSQSHSMYWMRMNKVWKNLNKKSRWWLSACISLKLKLDWHETNCCMIEFSYARANLWLWLYLDTFKNQTEKKKCIPFIIVGKSYPRTRCIYLCKYFEKSGDK